MASESVSLTLLKQNMLKPLRKTSREDEVSQPSFRIRDGKQRAQLTTWLRDGHHGSHTTLLHAALTQLLYEITKLLRELGLASSGSLCSYLHRNRIELGVVTIGVTLHESFELVIRRHSPTSPRFNTRLNPTSGGL
jgi:hypothetical protein